MSPLEKRAETMRARIRLRAWEARQVHGAKGSWYRLKRMLARSRGVYVVTDAAFAELMSEGFQRQPVGDELEPTRAYAFVPPARAARIVNKVAIAVRMSAEFLAAPYVVLVAFDESLDPEVDNSVAPA